MSLFNLEDIKDVYMTITLQPAVEVDERHRIEDEINSAIGQLGEVVGGGTGALASEIEIETSNPKAVEQIVPQVLAKLGIDESNYESTSMRNSITAAGHDTKAKPHYDVTAERGGRIETGVTNE